MNSPDVRRQSKMVVYNMYSYLKELVSSKPNAMVKELFLQTHKVTADMCGVSYRTVQCICAEADMTAAAEVLNNIPVLKSPKKKNLQTKPITDLDDFDKSIIPQSVQEFYDRGEYSTVAKLRACLIEKIKFSWIRKIILGNFEKFGIFLQKVQ
ncbi:hypothetical protein AVEN_128606-1 [Araneus ventricosus]|uniref:Uncharacterized protein n=1 Tax=Araneus ventricosus TaxID=182803 RepID=A0A4Y2RCY3_ARAVE|nr:hypothetical protein AVEN_128606-1 [Araneus ventricosus]